MALEAAERPLCLYGHTHLPVVYRADGNHVKVVPATASSPITLDGRRSLINPGSVGQPRDGDPDASYLVLDTEAGNMTLGMSTKEFDEAARAFLAGRPPDFSV